MFIVVSFSCSSHLSGRDSSPFGEKFLDSLITTRIGADTVVNPGMCCSATMMPSLGVMRVVLEGTTGRTRSVSLMTAFGVVRFCSTDEGRVG